MAKVLEVCVDGVESAVRAAQGGATRLELCAGLVTGGITPDETLFGMVRERVSLPARVLLRPRCGDFLYREEEFALLRRQVRRYADLGADWVVIGVLRADGALDEPRMAALIDETRGRCGVTLHRAFDLCRDPFAALDAAERLGVDTILTAGQAARCTDGVDLLRALIAQADKAQILVGAGVDAAAIRTLAPATGADAFHLSAKRIEPSGMAFRREGVPMGLPGLSEFEVWRCDSDAVRKARQALDACCGA